MSTCTLCGTSFSCAMVDGNAGPCWCTTLPPLVPVPPALPLPVPGSSGAQDAAPGCWCPACLRQHIAQRDKASPDTPKPA